MSRKRRREVEEELEIEEHDYTAELEFLEKEEVVNEDE